VSSELQSYSRNSHVRVRARSISQKVTMVGRIFWWDHCVSICWISGQSFQDSLLLITCTILGGSMCSPRQSRHDCKAGGKLSVFTLVRGMHHNCQAIVRAHTAHSTVLYLQTGEQPAPVERPRIHIHKVWPLQYACGFPPIWSAFCQFCRILPRVHIH
jgi:hypothetical protein